MVWMWFVTIQLIQLAATGIGWVLLIPFCLARAWDSYTARSIKDQRVIDTWRWSPLNWIYGNPEDGVSGQTALIWQNGVQVEYMPRAWAPWRAYVWSGWRNSCDNLKYVFRWSGGPWVRKTWSLFGIDLYLQAGWNTSGLPNLSLGRA